MSTFLGQPTSAYEYIMATSERFNQICKPLLNLGISYFGYIKLFDNGNYLFLDNYLKYRQAYFDSIINHGSFFTKMLTHHELKYGYLFIPPDIMKFDKRKDPILHLISDFHMWNGLCIYKCSGNFLECHNFSIIDNDNYRSTCEFYLSNLLLLERFIDYFHEQAADIIDTSDTKKLTYYGQKFNFSKVLRKKSIPENIIRFLEETKLQRRIIQGKTTEVKLSKRETECIQFLSHGYSMKEIGRALELTPRTIESYLRNVKHKTGYSSRAELLSSFLTLGDNKLNQLIKKY